MDLKEFTKDDVDYILGDKKFKTPPYFHQKVSALFIMDRPQAGIFSDIGTGKTMSVLYGAMLKGSKRLFVVCPNSVKSTWEDEAKKHTSFTTCVLKGTAKEKQATFLKDKSNIIITNYESLRWLMVSGKDKQGGNIIDMTILKHFKTFDMFVLDEIQKVKNHNALQSRLCRGISEIITCRVGLTGTPIENTLLDLFNQFLILDRGKTFGRNFYSYRNKYFDKIERPWLPVDDWEAKGDSVAKITEKMGNVVIRYSKDECLDLPEKVYEQRHIEMTDTQQGYIDILEEELNLYLRAGKIEIKNAMSRATKIAQVSGGFLRVMEGDKEVDVALGGRNPKMEELLDLIYEIPGKVIVFYRFIKEELMICDTLRLKKIKFVTLGGRTKNQASSIREFQKNKSIKVMVAHPKSGGIGVNLQVASYMIYYSNSVSYLDRHQSEGRIHRPGQTKKCVYIDLLGRNPIDKAISESLLNKQDLSNYFLQLIK